MRIKAIAAIRLCSSNFLESRSWYQSFLQIEPSEDLENFVCFNINGVRFEISPADEKSPSSTGGSVVYWHVENLEQAINHANSLGAKIYRGPLVVNEIKRTIVQIQDPMGNVFGLESEILN